MAWPVEQDIIELEFVEHVQAAQGGSETIASYLQDLYTDVSAWVHDAPLVEFEDEGS